MVKTLGLLLGVAIICFYVYRQKRKIPTKKDFYAQIKERP